MKSHKRKKNKDLGKRLKYRDRVNGITKCKNLKEELNYWEAKQLGTETITMNFDVRRKGDTLYVGILQKTNNEVNDITIKEVDLEDYSKRYVKPNRDLNNYDYMLIGFDELVNYMNELKVYEEGNILIEYNNPLLFTWLEKGLSAASQKKYKIKYETVLNHLEELIKNLGDNKVGFSKVSKNEVKKSLTDSELLKLGIVAPQSTSQFEITKKTNLSKNRVKSTSRVTGKDLDKKVIKLNRVNG